MRKYKFSVIVLLFFSSISVLLGLYLKKEYTHFDCSLIEENTYDFEIIFPLGFEEINLNIDDYLNFTQNSQIVLKVELIDKQIINQNVFSRLIIIENYSNYPNIQIGDEIKLLENYTLENNGDGFKEFSINMTLPIYKDNTYIVNIAPSDISNIYKYRFESFSCYEIAPNKDMMKINNELTMTKEDKNKVKFINELSFEDKSDEFMSFFGIENPDDFDEDVKLIIESALKMYVSFENSD